MNMEALNLLNVNEVARTLGISRPTLSNLRKRPDFPPPVLGMKRWKREDIEKFVERSKYN